MTATERGKQQAQLHIDTAVYLWRTCKCNADLIIKDLEKIKDYAVESARLAYTFDNVDALLYYESIAFELGIFITGNY